MITVVVPSNREECISKWVREWDSDLWNTKVIVVEDGPEATFKLPSRITHVSWNDINADLGDRGWFVPRRSSAIRSYGTLLAYRAGAEIIWHLDDDCYPEESRKGHYLHLLEETFKTPVTADIHFGWWNTIRDTGFYPRGYPYAIRGETKPVMVHHGLWSGVPDFDGKTQVSFPEYRMNPAYKQDVVPEGALFPMCGMNLAFRRQAAPLMYMMLMGKDWVFDRFDDMWAGLFVKLAADHLGWAVTSGAPSICHSRASDAARNAVVEAPGIQVHEELWRWAKNVSLDGCKTPVECYRRFSDSLPKFSTDDYWCALARAMHRWADLFEDVNESSFDRSGGVRRASSI
jgi:reversibly glycosylated polypeptide/UDP-arabinopyranose mutase